MPQHLFMLYCQFYRIGNRSRSSCTSNLNSVAGVGGPTAPATVVFTVGSWTKDVPVVSVRP